MYNIVTRNESILHFISSGNISLLILTQIEKQDDRLNRPFK